MTTLKNPIEDTSFTIYWTKFVSFRKVSTKKERIDAINARLRRTEKSKNPKQNISEYDIAAYF